VDRRQFGALAGATAVAGWLLPAGIARAATPAVLPKIAWAGPGTIGIQGVAVSPNGQVVATAAQDNTVKLLRASDGSLLHTLTEHIGSVASVAFTPDGQFLVSGGELVIGSNIGNVKLWRVSDGAFLGDFDHKQGTFAFSVAVSPDGTLLAAGHSGGQVNVWRIADRALVRTLIVDDFGASAVAFSPDGTLLAAAGTNIKIFRVATGALVRTLTTPTPVTSLAFAPDGSLLASASIFDQAVRLWRVSTLTLARTIQTGDTVNALAFSGDSSILASAGTDLVTLWRPTTGAQLRVLKSPSVSSLTFIGSATVVSGSFDGHVRLHRVADGTLTATFLKHSAYVLSVAFSPDGALFASGAGDFTARVWRASDGADVQLLAEQADVIGAVAFSPDSTTVASAAGGPPPDTLDVTIKIWKVGTAASVLTLPGHAGGTTGVAFSADGASLYSNGRDGVLATWNLADGSVLRFVRTGSPSGPLALSPDRTVIATGSTGSTVNLFDAGTLALLRSISTGTANALSFSGDGRLLAVGLAGYGNNVQIFDVQTGALVRTLPGDPNGFVQGVAFSPDSRILASGSGYTHLIQLWDPSTGTLLNSYDQETGWGPFPQLPLVFAPSGARLGYGRGDATVVVASTG
jgi:WD40 repeat protein